MFILGWYNTDGIFYIGKPLFIVYKAPLLTPHFPWAVRELVIHSYRWRQRGQRGHAAVIVAGYCEFGGGIKRVWETQISLLIFGYYILKEEENLFILQLLCYIAPILHA